MKSCGQEGRNTFKYLVPIFIHAMFGTLSLGFSLLKDLFWAKLTPFEQAFYEGRSLVARRKQGENLAEWLINSIVRTDML